MKDLRWLAGALSAVLTLLASPALAEDHACETEARDFYLWSVSTAEDATVTNATAANLAWKDAPVLGAADLNPRALAALGGRPAIVKGATLKGADFSGLTLKNICFVDSDLDTTHWTNARLEGVAFLQTKLYDADFHGAHIARSAFFNADLDDLVGARADLREVLIAGGTFSGLDLRGAVLDGVEMHCSLIVTDDTCEWPERTVHVEGATLRRTLFSVYRTDKWSFEGARLDHATVELNQLPQFRGAIALNAVTIAASGYGSEKVEVSPEEWQAIAAALVPEREGPSFDCARAASPVERRICAPGASNVNPLKLADANLAEVYRAALGAGRVTAADQRRWLATRDACLSRPETGAPGAATVEDCLSGLYAARQTELERLASPPTWLRHGEMILYVYSDPPFAKAFRATPTYSKLVPVIVDSSSSTLVVTVGAEPHGLSVSGAAWGANGHSCGMGAAGLTLDPKTGWFVGPHKPTDGDRRTREPVVRLYGDWAETEDFHGDLESDYGGCGMRAYFGRMNRIPATAEQIKAALKAVGPED